jgi:hypothetical protein
MGWGQCFTDAMHKEVAAKPWAHGTELLDQDAASLLRILKNDLEKEYA